MFSQTKSVMTLASLPINDAMHTYASTAIGILINQASWLLSDNVYVQDNYLAKKPHLRIDLVTPCYFQYPNFKN
jgi:hypothetical protein